MDNKLKIFLRKNSNYLYIISLVEKSFKINIYFNEKINLFKLINNLTFILYSIIVYQNWYIIYY